MTALEILLLKSSLKKIDFVAAEASDLFHDRLFQFDASLRDYFEQDREAQRRVFIQTLSMLFKGLDQPNVLAPFFRQLGLRHAKYYVRESHYDAVGEVLLRTLSQVLGKEFSLEVRNAWGRTYWLLAEIVKSGARDGVAKLERAVA